MMRVIVHDEVVAKVDDRLFGQFLERAGGEEPGPEAALDAATGRLHPEVLRTLQAMRIPLLRFPGGADVEFGQRWTTLIDHAPDRELPERPEGCRFGMHEFFDLCTRLKSEPLLVVSISAHVQEGKNLTLEESVALAAAEVAYCNLPLDAKADPEMLRWAHLRARNGHPEPFGVRLWQIGNEPFVAMGYILKGRGVAPEEIARQYVESVQRHLRAMKAVDPTIQCIVEMQMQDNQPAVPIVQPLLEAVGDEIAMLSYHIYQPWGIQRLEKEGKAVSPADMTGQELWYALASIPGTDPATGQSRWAADSMPALRAAGKPLAITEWNVNLWWAKAGDDPALAGPCSEFGNAVGAAGFLHAFLREAGLIRVGAQSMLVGSQWAIGGVDVRDLKQGRHTIRPTLAVTALYAQHHGGTLLRSECQGGDGYEQPWTVQNIRPMEKVAYLDVVVTADPEQLYVHVINRDLRQQRPLVLDLRQGPAITGTASAHRLIGEARAEAADPSGTWKAQTEPAVLEPLGPGQLRLVAPPASVNVYVLPRRPAGFVGRATK